VNVAIPVVASVVTEESLKLESFDVLNAIVAPLTKPFEASNARTCSAREDPEFAFKLIFPVGDVIEMLATFDVTLGVVVVVVVVVAVAGLLASPPPPPQAVSTAASSTPVIVLNNDIFTALFIPKKFSSTNCGQPKLWE
jgi:hypothetical protein